MLTFASCDLEKKAEETKKEKEKKERRRIVNGVLDFFDGIADESVIQGEKDSSLNYDKALDLIKDAAQKGDEKAQQWCKKNGVIY